MKVRATPGINFESLMRPGSPQAAAYRPIILALLAALLWLVSLEHVDIRQTGNLGLVSVLPLPVLAAPVILTISFCMALGQSRLRAPILLLHVVILVVMLYGMTTLIQDVPRFRVNYRHAGIAEYIVRTGKVSPRINAYFNWPGFFILSAFLTEIGGLPNALALVPWAPVFFNLLYLGPVLIIFSTGTSDKRQIWLAVWLYFLTNWIGQDYYAPQALNYFFYLVIIAILLKWFQFSASEPHWLWRRVQGMRLPKFLRHWVDLLFAPPDLPDATSRPGQRAGLIGIIAALAIVIAASHQATSLIAVASVAALAIFRRTSARGLPILIAVLVLAWISYMATAYMSGHFQWVVKGVGEVNRNIDANVTRRLRGSPEHIFIVRMRMIMTLAIVLMAMAGVVRRLRQGHWSWTSYALLAAAPFFVVLVQTYGGEMLLRAYLFALPANAFFAAALFYPAHTARTSRRTTLAVTLACTCLLAGFLFTRYGNEKADYFTTDELGAVRYFYNVAEPGSTLLTGAPNTPWKYQDIEKYKSLNITSYIQNHDVDGLYILMRDQYPKSYLILTRSQEAYTELYHQFPPEDWDAFEADLVASPAFKVVYNTGDAKVLVLSQAK